LLAHTHACGFASFSVLTPSSAAACVKSINLSDNLLTSTVVAELQQHLQRFPALQHVNMSDNPFLGTSGVTAIISSLAGA
jgi:Ran GTPase-activating protein (RanGAP) involved in mRNA processing and transport